MRVKDSYQRLTHCSKSSSFVQKLNFDFPKKLSIFLGWKTHENVVVYGSLAVDNSDFTRKIVKKIWVKNSWKCKGFCRNWIFGQKFDFSNSVCDKTRLKNSLNFNAKTFLFCTFQTQKFNFIHFGHWIEFLDWKWTFGTVCKQYKR